MVPSITKYSEPNGTVNQKSSKRLSELTDREWEEKNAGRTRLGLMQFGATVWRTRDPRPCRY